LNENYENTGEFSYYIQTWCMGDGSEAAAAEPAREAPKSDDRDRRDIMSEKRDRRNRDDDKDDMAQEYWNSFARMSFSQFAAGYQHAEPGVTDEAVRDSFLFGDTDGNFELSWHEFERLVAVGEGPPKDMHDKLEWYWAHFAHYPEKGMTMGEFYTGSQVESAGTSWEEIEGLFHELDQNGDDLLSREEFMSLH
jgi:hypothetical protein